MFAIALWDRTTRTLTLARDRAGEKPLFVARERAAVRVRLRARALLSLPWVGARPRPPRVALPGPRRLRRRGLRATRRSASCRPPRVLVVQDGSERTAPLLAAVGRARARAARCAAAPARRRRRRRRARATRSCRAVTSRVPAEVPFGVFLSGGIDSGLVAVLAARAWGRPFPTFSLRLEHRGYDESPLARRVARSIHAEHHEVVMTPREGERAFHDWAAGMDQPLGDPSVLPTWWLARDAARHVPVVLTGEGGDELFAGYPTYLGHRHAALADRLPQPVATPCWRSRARCVPGTTTSRSRT
jgi:asparagine synthase (glutamine-hydrolysing)